MDDDNRTITHPVSVDYLPTLNLVIYGVEVPLLIGAQFSCVLFLIVLKRTRSFHENLRLLLANFALPFLAIIISRYMIVPPVVLSYLFDTTVGSLHWCRIAKGIHDASIYVVALDMVVLVAERTVATVYARIYEESRNFWVVFVLISAQWVFALAFVWYNQANDSDVIGKELLLKPCEKEYLNPSAIGIFMGTIVLADVTAIAVFLYLLFINKRTYAASAPGLNGGGRLSERYQLSENVRTTRLLYPLMVVFFALSVIAVVVMSLAGNRIGDSGKARTPQQFYADIHLAKSFGQSFDIIVAFYALVFPQLAFYGHKSLWKEACRLNVCPIRRRRKVMHESEQHKPRGLNGKSLAFDVEAEREHHFKSLSELWDADYSRKHG